MLQYVNSILRRKDKMPHVAIYVNNILRRKDKTNYNDTIEVNTYIEILSEAMVTFQKNVKLDSYEFFLFFSLCIFFSGTKHPREDNPDLYYWAEMTGLHTQTFNI